MGQLTGNSMLNRSPVAIYDSVAEQYDRERSTATYEQRLEIYRTLMDEHAPTARRVLDLGCGTGTFTRLLADRGFDVVGLDASREMLRIAVGSERPQGSAAVTFVHGDFIKLPNLGQFDVALTVGEPFNYLKDEAELVHVLRNVAAVLDSPGLLIFDVLSRRSFTRMTKVPHVEEVAGVIRVIKGEAEDDATHINIRERRFSPHGDLWKLVTNVHRHTLFDSDAIRRCASQAGYAGVQLYGIRQGRLQDRFDDELHAWCIAVAWKQ
ncbi:class I SAM-dependent DNA methyltransferase [Micromonospora sp. DT201]|uniref:class I SAM-dependent DNA methyltransferase n=1 Tax=Micromonospora sp. DT201 TaxID=3393442 RepID=UPI003CF77997